MISKLPWRNLTFLVKGTNTELPVTSKLLNLKYTLLNGQAFSWYSVPFADSQDSINQSDLEESKELKCTNGKELFQGVFRKYFVQFTTKDDSTICYRAIPEDSGIHQMLQDYFQLSYDYFELLDEWKKSDPYFSKLFKDVSGIRIMKQDPFECLVGFICSQNNNIPRITKLIYSLCERFGNYIIEIDGKKFYSFPTLDQLKDVDEQTFRDMGFGYRAKYLVSTLKTIKEKGGENWLLTLRGQDHKKIQEELTSLMGIGKKVADCIALFSLDCKNSVPVDTHVHQIFNNVYKKGDKSSLTDKKYNEIGDFFRNKFGSYAGWAHSYLFTTELTEFKDLKSSGKEEEKVLIELTKAKKLKVNMKQSKEKSILSGVTIKVKGVEKTEKSTTKAVSSKKRKAETEIEVIQDVVLTNQVTVNDIGVVTRSRKRVKKSD